MGALLLHATSGANMGWDGDGPPLQMGGGVMGVRWSCFAEWAGASILVPGQIE